MRNSIKTNYLISILSFILTLFVFYLSLNQSSWFRFWSFLSIPPQPAFSDLKAHVYFFECFEIGIDIFKEKCTLIPAGGGEISTHPSIWLYIVKLLKLNNEIFFNTFVLISYFLYFFFLLNFFKIFKSKESKFFLLIFLFSTTNFILIERFSTDLIIFIIVSSLLYFNSSVIKFILIILGTILKLYPVFLISIFVENKKKLFFFSIILLLFLSIFYLDQVVSTNENLKEMALLIAYGSRTMLKALYYISDHYNLFINKNNLDLFRNITLLCFFLYSAVWIFLGYRYSKKSFVDQLNDSEKFFIIGASIYIGTFIIAANGDYRLIFLAFTVPYILEMKNKILKLILGFCIIISINSFLFQFGDYISISFFMRAILVFGCKFTIFTIFLFIYGDLLKKIKFFRIN